MSPPLNPSDELDVRKLVDSVLSDDDNLADLKLLERLILSEGPYASIVDTIKSHHAMLVAGWIVGAKVQSGEP